MAKSKRKRILDAIKKKPLSELKCDECNKPAEVVTLTYNDSRITCRQHMPDIWES